MAKLRRQAGLSQSVGQFVRTPSVAARAPDELAIGNHKGINPLSFSQVSAPSWLGHKQLATGLAIFCFVFSRVPILVWPCDFLRGTVHGRKVAPVPTQVRCCHLTRACCQAIAPPRPPATMLRFGSASRLVKVSGAAPHETETKLHPCQQ